ncbi:predicted protein [Histoplasma capsulatum var. duboisii H88]|uniref:Predicted protein n=1 Tax=Ajellomyces capsulatus (strain H88) TaxID=544711 RepID=F0URE3_AJEC8|nr:predicted protein [Histoplasma capsulatum var. duboisii H88]
MGLAVFIVCAVGLWRTFQGCSGVAAGRQNHELLEQLTTAQAPRLFGHSSTLDWVDNGTKNFPEFLQQERKRVEPPITKSRQSQPHINRRKPASEYAASPLTVTVGREKNFPAKILHVFLPKFWSGISRMRSHDLKVHITWEGSSDGQPRLALT